MAVQLLADRLDEHVALYCSTDMVAFGPVFDSEEAAQDFLKWLPMDARTYQPDGLKEMHGRWHELAYDVGGEFVGRDREPAEPTDDDIYSPSVYVPDTRGENDWSL